jgi:hypothetical protein
MSDAAILGLRPTFHTGRMFDRARMSSDGPLRFVVASLEVRHYAATRAAWVDPERRRERPREERPPAAPRPFPQVRV